jgi:predicted RNA-binding Zn-ribbon protein involved in translation (DUF1610 family)
MRPARKLPRAIPLWVKKLFPAVAAIFFGLSIAAGGMSLQRGRRIIAIASGAHGSLFLRNGAIYYCTDPTEVGPGGVQGTPRVLFDDYLRDDSSGSFLGFRVGDGLTYWFFAIPFWAISLAAASLCVGSAIAFGPRRFRPAPRPRANGGRCVRCGYDLRATYDRCPECGLKLSRIRRAGGSVMYQQLLVGKRLPSKPCGKCGLELAGVTALQCPQCGERLPENEAKMLSDRGLDGKR